MVLLYNSGCYHSCRTVRVPGYLVAFLEGSVGLTGGLWPHNRRSSKDDDNVDDILKVHFVVS